MRLDGPVLIVVGGVVTAAQGGVPPADFTIAFFGDQGHGADTQAVLQLIADEGTDVVVHAGDFDYKDDPQGWDQQITDVLGPCFPYFAAVGNHDSGSFYGSGGYQEFLAARMQCLELEWDGDLGARSSHSYQGILFVLTAPDVFGDGDTEHAPYIQEQLAADQSIWRISSWHKLMTAMQIGGKPDDAGWGVYEQSRRGGAIIATAHEHSYARTHALSHCPTQTVASFDNDFEIGRDDPQTPEDEGVTFVFHSGLGGRSIRDQERCLPAEAPYGCNGEWASMYAEQQGANHGALFGVFGHQGDPCRARFYFKDIAGDVVDEFFVTSTLGPCPCAADVDDDGEVGILDFLLVVGLWGTDPGGMPDIDGDGTVGITEFLLVLGGWGPCG